jgi:hypothetical protein
VAVDLADWTLSDNPDNPDDHTLESFVLAPGEHLLLWADNDLSRGPDHLDFSLAREGGTLLLSGPDGRVVDQVDYPVQALDVAAARSGDGGDGWVLTLDTTPGAANGDAGLAAADPGAPEGPCDPVSDLAQPYFLEGEAVSFAVTCGGSLALDQAELVSLGVPDGAVFDDASLTLSWDTGPASGGRHDLVFSERAAGATDRVPAASTVTFWVADNPDIAGAVAVEPLTYTEEWGLPVFHITHEGSLTESYTAGETTYRGVTTPHQIKIRGAASVSYPKNSWTVKYDDPELEVEDWGRSRDHLVFLTTFDDNSFVRQKLIYDVWEAMAEHAGEARLTPRSFFGVVYLQGVYHGLYVVIDHVDNEFVDHFGLSRDGNLYKSINHDANFELTDYYGNLKSTLHNGYEERHLSRPLLPPSLDGEDGLYLADVVWDRLGDTRFAGSLACAYLQAGLSEANPMVQAPLNPRSIVACAWQTVQVHQFLAYLDEYTQNPLTEEAWLAGEGGRHLGRRLVEGALRWTGAATHRARVAMGCHLIPWVIYTLRWGLRGQYYADIHGEEAFATDSKGVDVDGILGELTDLVCASSNEERRRGDPFWIDLARTIVATSLLARRDDGRTDRTFDQELQDYEAAREAGSDLGRHLDFSSWARHDPWTFQGCPLSFSIREHRMHFLLRHQEHEGSVNHSGHSIDVPLPRADELREFAAAAPYGLRDLEAAHAALARELALYTEASNEEALGLLEELWG